MPRVDACQTLSRRCFLQGFAATGAAVGLTPFTLRAAEPNRARQLRVIAYNVYKCTGWPSDRPLARAAVAQRQMADRLAMQLALYEPDIVNFSESPDEALTRQVAERLEMHHVRFPSGDNWPGTLLSRFEILESANAPLVEGPRPKELFTRHWGRATLRLADGEPLVVHSVHLFPVADPTVRLREIDRMLESMRPDLAAGRSMLLIGDLNHTPRGPEYPRWIEAGWIDSFARVGTGEGLTMGADKPHDRIDYVFCAGPIAQRLVESRPLFEGAFRLNPSDPAAFALSDHLPQYAAFALAGS